ncbi:hypothetical protein RHDC1_01685 [Rhodocyclaceae bacterium]|nr:hypothetical protein RHDC1_01685 [Rhodocyclaceae bacterium]
MKLKTLSILILGALPAIALAAGDPAGGHGMEAQQMMQGHDMSTMQKAAPASMAGKPGDPAKVSRTIEVTMDDAMQFTPGKISVKAGETVRLFVKNAGKTPHEMVIGTLGELKDHAEMMRKMPGMQHAEPNMVTLKAGQRGGIVWQFDKPGTVDFACLVPGHMEAGMTGRFFIEPLAENGS